MIGVIANPADQEIAREFFELFKTPWEFCRSGQRYEVLLCAGDGKFEQDSAKVVLIYAGRNVSFDTENSVVIASQRNGARILSYAGMQMPIYGNSVTFREPGGGVQGGENSHEQTIYLDQSNGRVVARIGYDLFDEIRGLLTVGQPAANAGIPALELHIDLLRNLITAGGVPLVEVPPVPEGYRFIACLTHDVDHPSIRLHKFDHTMFGFLYRSIPGSAINFCRGRISARNLLANWLAAFKLPFVYLGLAPDFWAGFDRYVEMEKGARSTFFIIPFKNNPGRSHHGSAPQRRASRYGAVEVTKQIRSLMSAGCEVGVHGIDAWVDSSQGRAELEQIRSATGIQEIGARMHWLYFDAQSPATLEEAGVVYDSTVGYNETIGFRAGTTQVYKPLGASHLLELPLHVMDTALFYPSYLDLSPEQARKHISRIVDGAVRYGGCVTVNWHDRSIAPERLWGDVYANVVDELKAKGAWFATAAQAVSWFRKRRSVTFENVAGKTVRISTPDSNDAHQGTPALRLRIHQPRQPRGQVDFTQSQFYPYRDITFTRTFDCAALAFPGELLTSEKDRILQ